MKINKIDIDTLHKVQYNILIEFDRICKLHGLKYYLGFGSLLGAIRHEGFIPWDDDIDVLMMYEDFEKLKIIDPKEWTNGYFLQCPETDPEYNKCYIKIRDSRTTLIVDDAVDKNINHGVSIDVEPLVGLADDVKIRKMQYLNTKIYMLLRYNEPPKNHGKIMNLGGKLLLSLIPENKKEELRNKYLKKILLYDKLNTEYLYIINGNVEMMMDLHKRAIFDDYVMKKFENDLFPVPVGYDEWLSTRYGNYMKLPQEDQQGIKLEHYLQVDLNHPYTEYKGKFYCIAK